MARTKEQIKARILPNQLVKRRKEIVWGDIVSSIASASTVNKEALLDKLKLKDYSNAGRILSEILMVELSSEVSQSIDVMLANNSLNLDELSEIFE